MTTVYRFFVKEWVEELCWKVTAQSFNESKWTMQNTADGSWVMSSSCGARCCNAFPDFDAAVKSSNVAVYTFLNVTRNRERTVIWKIWLHVCWKVVLPFWYGSLHLWGKPYYGDASVPFSDVCICCICLSLTGNLDWTCEDVWRNPPRRIDTVVCQSTLRFDW